MKALLVLMLAVLAWTASCGSVAGSDAGGAAPHPVSVDLGLLPIGAKLKDARLFETTDCVPDDRARMADCSAVDRFGRRYAFFDQRLARVSMDGAGNGSLPLPGKVVIGQEFNTAVEAVERAMKVKFNRSVAPSGATVAITGFVVRSATGEAYAVELVSSRDGRLAKFIERSEF